MTHSRVQNKRWVYLIIFEKFEEKNEKWPQCFDICKDELQFWCRNSDVENYKRGAMSFQDNRVGYNFIHCLFMILLLTCELRTILQSKFGVQPWKFDESADQMNYA